MEHDLQQEVAKLFGQIRPGAEVERVVDLVGLLDEERLEGLVVLFPIQGQPSGWRSRCTSQGRPKAEAGLDWASSAGSRCGPAASARAVTSDTVVSLSVPMTGCAGGYSRCSSDTGSAPWP